MEVAGNGGELREPGRKGNRSGITPGGLLFGLFARDFWLFGWLGRYAMKPR
jgi:hypothetical protein